MRFVITVLFFFSVIAYGATIPTSSYEQVERNIDRQQKEQQELERQKRLKHIEEEKKEILPEQAPPRKSNLGKIEKGICFEIETITLKGATKLSGNEEKELLKPYQKKCITPLQINNLLAEISNWYFRKGFITTRVYIPEQNVKIGTLVFDVVEGSLEKIVQNDDKILDKIEMFTAFPISKKEIINIRDMEQGVDNLNRLQSSNAETKIIPGTEPGTTIIQVINKKKDALRGYFSVDNSLNTEGDPKVNLRLEHDNTLHLNDQFQFFYGTGLMENNSEQVSRNHGLNYSIPYGYWKVRTGYNYYRSLTTLNFSEIKYPYENLNYNYNVGLDYVLYRAKSSVVTLFTTLTYKDRKTYFADTFLETSSRRTGNIDLGAGYTNRYSMGFYDLRFTIIQGTKFFGAKQDNKEETSPVYPKAQFRKYTIDGSICHYFSLLGSGFKYCSNGRMQLSEDTLYSEEQIGVGDKYSVRGFNQGTFMGDSGVYVRNELSKSFPYWGKSNFWRNVIQPEVFIGFDFGYVGKMGSRDLYDGQDDPVLAGLAVGFRNNGRYLSFGITVAAPIGQPRFIRDIEGRNTEYYLDLTIKLF